MGEEIDRIYRINMMKKSDRVSELGVSALYPVNPV
jgi:hypothetical protein